MKAKTIVEERFFVRIEFTEPILGTAPKDPSVYATYIETKKPPAPGEINDVLLEEYKEIDTGPDNMEERGWTGFMKDEKGIFIYNYLVKGFLKNAGNVLKEQLKIKNLRSKIDNLVFVYPRKLYFGGKKPDGVLERPLRAMTPQGPRITLARSDMIEAGAGLEFEVVIVKNKEVTRDVIKTLFEFGQHYGLGQWRNAGYGTFRVVKFSKVEAK